MKITSILFILTLLICSSCQSFLPGSRNENKEDLERGIALYQQGKLDQAETLLKETAKVLERNPALFVTLGRIALQKTNWREAIDHFNQALSIDPYSAPAYAGLGEAAYLKADYKLARSQLSKALELDAREIHARFLLGKVYLKLEVISQAISQWEIVLDLDPGHQEAQAALKEALFLEEALRSRGELEELITDNKISRVKLAILIFSNFKLSEIKADFPLPPDLQSRKEAPALKAVLALDLFQTDKKGNFYPEQAVSRLDLALALAGLYYWKTEDKSMRQVIENMQSPFNDLPANHPLFPEVMTVISLGLMEATFDGQFLPDQKMTGKDIYPILNKALEMFF